MTPDVPHNSLARSNLTASQLLLWTGQRLQPDDPLYNMAIAFRIGGALDGEAFPRAFDALVARCDAMRTVFVEQDGVPMYRVLTQGPQGIEFIDLSAATPDEDVLVEMLRERSRRNFALHECLYDSALIKLDAQRFVWFLNQHHLITDASSFAVQFRALGEFYALAVNDRLHEARELPSYVDYLTFENAGRAATRREKAGAFWASRLERAAPRSSFYRNTPPRRRGVTARVPRALGTERSAALRTLAQQPDFQGFTLDLALHQVFLTTLFAYLHRITGNAELAIGTPIHNRSTAAFKDTAGLFIELFPLQVAVDSSETFRSLYKKVAREMRQVLLHAAPGSSTFDHQRAYDVVLNFITTRFGGFAGLPVQSHWLHAGFGDRNHLLRLQVHDFDATQEFSLDFDVNVDAFVGPEQRWTGDHFLRLLDAFIADPDRDIGNVALVSARELAQIAPPAHRAAVPAVTETLVQLFERQVAQGPERVAVRCEGQRLSYAQLNAQANRLAHYLIKRGAGPGVTIAVALQRSPEALVAFIGVLKSGACYLPLDPDYPPDRLAYIISDAAVALVLTLGRFHDRLATVDAALVDVNPDTSDFARCSEQDPLPRAGLGDLAYIIYTSGSTGRPKGVQIGHHGLANYLTWAARQYLDGAPRVFALFSSLTFDLTVTSMFVPLISGGSVVVYAPGDDPREITIRRVVEDNEVEVIKLTPAHLGLIQSLDFSGSRIRTLIVGGDDLKVDVADAISRRFGGNVTIFNEYGPTEATVGCMIYRFNPKHDASGSVPIGRAIDNLRIHLLDAARNPVPRGVVGEIYIGGLGLAHGYLNQPEETSQRFVPDPVHAGERLYRTGDLGRWNARGELEYLGREDHQVKIRGVRVELGEVEATLLEHPAIRECVVEVLQRQNPQPAAQTERFCGRCGLPANHPDAMLDENDVCEVCRVYDTYRERALDYFGTMDDLRAIAVRARQRARGPHDCLMLLSGGKDSTYALCQLVELGFNPLVFTLDNGFISEGAKANMRRVVERLELELVIGRTPAMNSIFADSLNRHSNVCNGCFKTIYTLSMNLARERGIHYIVTGLSRGQIFETRLADMCKQRIFDPRQIDATIVAARKAYHRMDDALSQLLDVEIFRSDEVFEEIEFIDFYRYCDATLDEVLSYLARHVPWIRPQDTGRSTNCLINAAGIYVHTRERGYHNYALPYSWDVRLGHKERDAARAELDDDLDVGSVQSLLAEVGYQVRAPATGSSEQKSLIAYCVAERELSRRELQAHLAARLPEEFIPARFVMLDELPLSAHGKVDRKALPRPTDAPRELAAGYVAPRDETETLLAGIWADVLGVEKVGVEDDFFDLGGDSILNIQIVTRARAVGLSLSPQQIFDHPTVSALARVAESAATVEATQTALSGPLPLLPMQRRFFAQGWRAPAHYTQSVRLDCGAEPDLALLQRALEHVLIHHDALRCRFRHQDGEWHQEVASVDEVSIDVQRVSLHDVPAADRAAAVTQIASALSSTLDLSAGTLVRTACLDFAGRSELLIVIHHLVVDGVSWWVLLQDLNRAFMQLQAGAEVRLPHKTASIRQWSEALAAYVGSPAAQEEASVWRQELDGDAALLHDSGAAAEHRQIARLTSPSIGAAVTEKLLRDVSSARHIQVPELLLAALALVVNRWRQRASLRLEIEGHGREELTPGLDTSRTVGWFTSLYPLALEVSPAATPDIALERVKQRLRALPKHGVGYAILRYLSPDGALREQLATNPAALLFNYLGQWDQMTAGDGPLRLLGPVTVSRDPTAPLAHALEVNAVIFAGELQVTWSYRPDRLSSDTVGALAAQFSAEVSELIDYCLANPQASFVPADFPEADLDQEQLDRLLADFGD